MIFNNFSKRTLIFTRPALRLFCQQKSPINETSQKSNEFSQSELLKTQKIEENQVKKSRASMFWNDYRQNLLQVIKESEPQKPKGTEEYRAAILFEELLNKQKMIIIYDCHGRVYWLNTLFELFLVSVALWYGYNNYLKERWRKRKDEQFKIALAIFFIFSRCHYYRRLQKYHVEKIIYDTESKNFKITQRNLFGIKNIHDVKKDQLLYTQDKFLNVRNINYIDIESMKCYQIGYNYAWKNKELFTHLLKQNIQSIRQKK